MNVIDNINEYLFLLKKTLDNLNPTEIVKVYEILLNAYENRKAVYICGNGGSASTASHMVCDFNKGTCLKQTKKFKVYALNDNIPFMLAISNDISYEDLFIEQLKNYLESEDILIGISGSGNSKNVIKAIEYANNHGAITIGFCGYDGGELKKKAKFSIHVNVDDMQISEDVHMILDHLLMKLLYLKINED